MKRREFVQGAAGAALAAMLPGCNGDTPVTPPPSQPVSRLVDVHCHLFNSSDLPVVRFIKIVFAHDYPRQGVSVLDIKNPDAVDGLILLATWILGRTRSPSALEEVAVLSGSGAVKALHADHPANQKAVVDQIAEFSMQRSMGVSGGMSPNGPLLVRQALLRAASGGGPLGVADMPLSKEAAGAIADKAFNSSTNIGLYLRWIAIFTRYRYVLADDLTSFHRRQGFEPVLLCPAAVDYDYWLGESVDRSPMPDQVTVMGRLARRTAGTPIHGYVGFDPLRQAYFTAGRFTAYDPLGQVRRAIVEEGFVGVKLYPPMGFKPIDNSLDLCQAYPADSSTVEPVKDLAPGAAPNPAAAQCTSRPIAGSDIVGRKIDDAMAALFDLCVRKDVDASVIAHANDSNGSNAGYGERADPTNWIPVFRRWPTLRVSLGHFGNFENRAASAAPATPMPEASWEWALGGYLKRAGDPPVFADVSYMTSVFGKTPAQMADYTKTFVRWIETFDPECRHLIFGTDWSMLAKDPDAERFTRGLYDFFQKSCGLDQARLDRIFFANAARFLGLRANDPTRDRLLRFYDKYGVPRARLPVLV